MVDSQLYSPTSPTISSFPKNNRKSVTLSKTATLRKNEDCHLQLRNKQKEICTKYILSGKHVHPLTWSSSSWGEGRRPEQTHKSFYHKLPPAGWGGKGAEKLITFRHFINETTLLKLEKLIGDTHHDVGISVQELDAFFQTPEAALQTAQQEPGKLILGSYERQYREKSNTKLNVSLHCNIIDICQLHLTRGTHQMSVILGESHLLCKMRATVTKCSTL